MSENLYKIKPADNLGYTWPNRSFHREIWAGDDKLDWVSQDGPFLLQDLPDIRSLDTVSHALFGEDLKTAVEKSTQDWRPYIANGESHAKRIIITGATNAINARDGVDISYLKNTGSVLGANSILETREIALANSGDVVFGNSQAWRDVAATRNDIEAYTIDKGFLNYNSHRWLYKVLENTGEDFPTDVHLQTIINHIAIDPNVVLQLYATDDETQLFFRYLKQKANEVRAEIGLPPIDKLKVDANSAATTEHLSTKGYLYPKPSEVEDLSVEQDTFESWLEAEGNYAPIQLELNERTPRMPGYNLSWSEDRDQFAREATTALDLLQNRWGVKKVYFKHTAGADGGSSFGQNLQEGFDREGLIDKLFDDRHSWVVEPFVDYKTFDIDIDGEIQTRKILPSLHVRGGRSYDNKLFQIMVMQPDSNGQLKETTEWGGHIYVPRGYADRIFDHGGELFGLNRQEYESGFQTWNSLIDKFKSDGFSRGGVDLAVGTIDTRWGRQEVSALQDMNIRTNGGDTTRAFGQLVQREWGEEKPFVTLVFKPREGQSLQSMNGTLDELSNDLGIGRKNIKLMCVIPPGWGIFGTVADTPEEAFVNAMRIERELRSGGVIR